MILNLTQHKATQAQIEAGVVDLPEDFRQELVQLLTFNELPSCEEVEERANLIRNLVIDLFIDEKSPIKEEVLDNIIKKVDNTYYLKNNLNAFSFRFMIGGALFLMPSLIEALKPLGEPLFAFSRREVVEKKNDNGSVTKTAIFKHIGFVPAC